MSRTKKLILIAWAVLWVLSCCVFTACGDNGSSDTDNIVDIGDNNNSTNSDNSQKIGKWYYSWDVVESSDTDGGMGASARELSPNGQYFIVCNYRCDEHVIDDGSFELKDFTRSLRFTLVLNDGVVLYDSQAVEIGGASLNGADSVEVNLNAPRNSRFIPSNILWYSSDDSTFAIAFAPKQEGTLYVDFALERAQYDNVCSSKGLDYYMVGEASADVLQVAVNNVSVGYVANDKYNNGNFDDGDLTLEPDFSGGNAYMVLDFDFNAAQNNDDNASISAVVSVFATALKATIAEAPTGSVEERTESGVTKMYASFKVPPQASENKPVRMLVQLSSLSNENDVLTEFSVDVLFVGAENAIVSNADNSRGSYTYVVDDSLLTFEPTINGYAVTGVVDNGITSLVIPQRYNGYEVCEVKQGALAECQGLQSVKIPFVGSTKRESDCGVFSQIFDVVLSDNDNNVPQSLTKVIVSEGIASIGEEAFHGCGTLETIEMPSSITTIGRGAFNGCGLKSVEIPDSVISIGYSAFQDCSSLQSVVFAENTQVAVIDEYTFYLCRSLSSICIPSSVTSIKECAFDGCSSLQRVSFGENSQLTAIGSFAFRGCTNLQSVVFAENSQLTVIGEYAFNVCGFKSMEIPDSVISIGYRAFYGCSYLESITVPFVGERRDGTGNTAFAYIFGDNLNVPSNLIVKISDGITSIGASAFSYCSAIAAIDIPNSVTTIDQYAFRECRSLTSIEIPSNVTSIEMYAFDGCNSLQKVAFEKNSQLTTIGEYAFNGCGFKSVEIPDSVISIGYCAFNGCTSLESITVPFVGKRRDGTGNTSFNWIFGYNQDVPSNLIVKISEGITSIVASAFSGCDTIAAIDMPNSVTTIGKYAFSGCSGLTDIEISKNVTTIGDFAFYECAGLVDIEIPDSVISLGTGVFTNCSCLQSLTIPFIGSSREDEYTYRFKRLFRSYSSSVEYIVPSTLKKVIISEGITSIGKYAFSDCEQLEYISIPDSVTNIGAYSFNRCSGLTSVRLSKNIVAIGGSAFNGCINLDSIEIPYGVTTIGFWAFCNCSKLQSINIPSSVTTIGSMAFYGCSGLTEVEIPSSVTSISGDAFGGCELENITVSEGNTVYYSDGNCLIEASTKTLVIGCKNSVISADGSVVSIGSAAFSWCSNLTSIEIPSSVTSIGESAFSGCSSLLNLTYNGTMQEWFVIDKESWWCDDTPDNLKIYCTDGVLDKDDNVVTE